ncbi:MULTISPECIES: alpha/beta hydrolase [Lysinibacillus]|uniref:Esterase n=1 Tax=Lysinibacillus antri TaxID=2498145 RepID=A0A432LGC5_9BACI|nr:MULTISPECIES: esterase [Lysinibacillus]RUL57005.1 esterase [Lysinibacillus antri]TSI03360.1 esterase [Lysinibacillus sp. BW-2-10]
MKSPYIFKHLQPAIQNEEKKPAIFLFHGLGSNEEDLLQLIEPFRSQCHIFSLRGPITHSPGYAFYTFEEEGKPTREIFDKMIVLTKQFIEEAIEHFHLDEKRLFVIGFNQGAVVAQTLAVVLAEKIRGTAVLSGFLPQFVKTDYRKVLLESSRIFISHGEYDYDYPIRWAEESKDFFIELGAEVTYKTYLDGHGVTPENLQDLITFITEDLVETIN